MDRELAHARSEIEAVTGQLAPIVWRAAQAGARHYCRSRHLPHLLRVDVPGANWPRERVVAALDAALVRHARLSRRYPWAAGPGRFVALVSAALAERVGDMIERAPG